MAKKAKTAQRDLTLDELIRQFIRCQERLEKATGGYLAIQISFGPKPAKEKRATGSARDAL